MSKRIGMVIVFMLVLSMSAFAQLQIKNSAATPAVLMHITQDGTVGIGTTLPDAATKLDVNGKTKTATFQMTTAPAANYVMTSDASGNGTWAAPASLVEVDGIIGNEMTNVTNATLLRAGSGTTAAPYTVALNLASVNTWTGKQTLQAGVRIGTTTTGYDMPLAQGTTGQFLAYNGTWATPAPVAEIDGIIGNEVNNATNTTLTRSGSGTTAAPYTLGLNLANANTWTALQTFQATLTIGSGTTAYTMPSAQGTSGQFLSYNGTWATPTVPLEIDGIIGNEMTNVTNASLVRAGSGTSAAPYTVALNLNNPNTWTATGIQTFTNQIVIQTGTNKFTISTN